MAAFPIVRSNILSNAFHFRGEVDDEEHEDEASAPALIATTQSNAKPKESNTMADDPKRLAKLREIQARNPKTAGMASASMMQTEFNQVRAKLTTMSAKDRSAALARMNESQRAIVAMDAKAATTTRPKPATAKPAAKPGLWDATVAKFGGKPGESLTESVYKKRREQAAGTHVAPEQAHAVGSKEHAAQVYAKRNGGRATNHDHDD